MARPRSLDRDHILDVTEAIILDSGGQGVTLDAVVARSGASKGGIVGAYGNKEGLIRAVLEREFDRFSNLVSARLGPDPAPEDVLRAFVEESGQETNASLRKMSFLMAAVIHSADLMEPVRAFYARHFGPLRGPGPDQHIVQRIFFSIEGASLMRGLGVIEMTDAEWEALIRSSLDSIPTGR